jgi:hypothetical protein
MTAAYLFDHALLVRLLVRIAVHNAVPIAFADVDCADVDANAERLVDKLDDVVDRRGELAILVDEALLDGAVLADRILFARLDVDVQELPRR